MILHIYLHNVPCCTQRRGLPYCLCALLVLSKAVANITQTNVSYTVLSFSILSYIDTTPGDNDAISVGVLSFQTFA